ncbi:MAG: DNA-3-methyladenine glycosylase 2 family protein [Sporomusaceae bacterium]|nr:DNA-3-methyladenine glycosylase 2 family protein [Sporomusaceae bacterium]
MKTVYRGELDLKEKILRLEQTTVFFEYGQTEIDYLKKRDKKLGQAIDRIGPIRRKVMPDIFSALVNSIISQQISGRAADTIWERFSSLLGEITPAAVAAANLAAIQKCGMSLRKAAYIQGAAQAALDGSLDFTAFAALSDAEIIQKLSALNGIGVWTAEMLLIFSLCRPDVLSWGDLAIRRGLMNLHNLKTLDQTTFEKFRKKYSPHGTVASLYLWAVSVKQ